MESVHSGAQWVRKFGYLYIQEIWSSDDHASVRTPAPQGNQYETYFLKFSADHLLAFN